MALAEARAAIQAGNVTWGEARVADDREALERMLAPGLFVRLPDRRLTGREFVDRITSPPPGVRHVCIAAGVLTVQPDGDVWVALTLERIERVTKRDDGSTARERILAVTRDGWKQEGDRWRVLCSELLGEERWPDGVVPPVRGWWHPAPGGAIVTRRSVPPSQWYCDFTWPHVARVAGVGLADARLTIAPVNVLDAWSYAQLSKHTQ